MASTAPPAHGARHDWRDFIALPDEDRRELIEGELVELEVPNWDHERIVAALIRNLGNWAHEHGAVVVGSGYKIRVSEHRGVMPDVQLFRKGKVPVGCEQGLVEGAPDLAVEVISPSSRRYDRVVKLRYYAEIGLGEYWLVDPEAHSVERLVLEEGGYRIAQALSGDAVFEPASFPGLAISLSKLFSPR